MEQPSKVTQPTDVAQTTEVETYPEASAISHILNLKMAMPPQMPLAADSSMTQQPRQLASNYNNADAYQQYGGTDIQDIITSTYSAECFKLGVAFLGLLMPLRFNDNLKFQHFLDLFDAVVTYGQCEILGKPDVEKTEIKIFQ